MCNMPTYEYTINVFFICRFMGSIGAARGKLIGEPVKSFTNIISCHINNKKHNTSADFLTVITYHLFNKLNQWISYLLLELLTSLGLSLHQSYQKEDFKYVIPYEITVCW